MYISVRNAPTTAPPRSRRRGRVPGTVFVLGFVSLLTDISTEMVAAVLPLFVTAGLGLSPLAFGIVDSVYQAGTAAARVAGGYVADRWNRPKGVATTGYALGAAAKVLLLPVTSLAGLSAAVATDRLGKGIRTGPRDALIAGSSSPDMLGRAFGVHRTLDTAGAMLGPVLAFYLLLAAPADFDLIFTVAACFAGLGVLLLIGRVRPDRPRLHPVPVARTDVTAAPDRAADGGGGDGAVAGRPAPALRQLFTRSTGFRRLLLVALPLSALTISDAFIYLTLLERGLVTSTQFPLLFLATSATYLAAAVPVGRLSDRLGRTRVFLAGHLLVVCTYLVAGSADTLTATLAALGMLGLYYAATDGVLPAAASPLVPSQWRSTAISALQTAVAVGRAAAALTFGAVWAAQGYQAALWLFAAGLAVAVLGAARGLAHLDTEASTREP